MLLLRGASSSVLPPAIRSSRSSSRSFHGRAANSVAVVAVAATAEAKKGNLSRGLIDATSSGGNCLGVAASVRFSKETKTAAAAVEYEMAGDEEWSPEDPDGKLPPNLKVQDNPPTGGILSATWGYQHQIFQVEAYKEEEEERPFIPLEIRVFSKRAGRRGGITTVLQLKFSAKLYHGYFDFAGWSLRRKLLEPGGVEGVTVEFVDRGFYHDLLEHDGIKLPATLGFIYHYLTNKQK